jgi:hypothetical protein
MKIIIAKKIRQNGYYFVGHYVVQWKFTDVSGECSAFIFRVKEQVKQATSKSGQQLLPTACLLGSLFNYEVGRIRFL